MIQYWMAWGWYLQIVDELYVWKISDDAKRSVIFFIHVANPILSGVTRKKPSNICIIISQNLTWINVWKVDTYLPNNSKFLSKSHIVQTTSNSLNLTNSTVWAESTLEPNNTGNQRVTRTTSKLILSGKHIGAKQLWEPNNTESHGN